ncbi:TadE/TadG family type IV pilus assembly protein [Actibacterium ureilyticum]|uniref:TadE/TadG family type IV pilus assembly protein n=1 Tax=Actibacterium ureilyticum TaxID=1590614 RepID=UPI0015956F80|nr:TadE/TadG family type IV pilus assembly protein [Actibacterium ureilyticum]
MARDRARASVAGFHSDERGALIVFGLVLLIMMFMIAGLAIDVIRLEVTRTRIQNTLDRAVLAAADLQNAEDAKEVVNDYFKKADLGQYMSDDQIDVDYSQNGSQLTYRMVEATSQANVKTMFMHMMGIETLVAAGKSVAEEGISETEVSLVVDVSGSMDWDAHDEDDRVIGTKIEILQEAAKDFVYFLQCDSASERPDLLENYSSEDCTVTPDKVSISLIPYSEQVVAGSRMFEEMVTTADHNYAHCLEFTPEEFETATIIATDPNNPARQAGYFRDYPSGWNYGENWNCRPENWRQIRPFMDDYGVAATRIDQLEAGGSTSIDYGVKWGAAMLHESFRPVIAGLAETSDNGSAAIVNPAFASRPYGAQPMNAIKALVLMTDGVNDVQRMLKDGYRSGPSAFWRNVDNPNDASDTVQTERLSVYHQQRDDNGQDPYYYPHDGSWNAVPYGDAAGYETTRVRRCNRYGCWYENQTEWVEQPGVAENIPFPVLWKDYDIDSTYNNSNYSWLGDPLVAYANAEKVEHTKDVCEAAKNNGIVVYTIGLEVEDGLDVLKECATTEGHFFKATGENLSDVFFAIASSIDKLRLTQ